MGNIFVVERSTEIAAAPAALHALIVSLPEWQKWSPWEDIDPHLGRTYTGPTSGVGSSYAWVGNRKAGAGTMKVTEATAEHIAIDITFTRPFKAANTSTFTLTPVEGGSTLVVWRMAGKQPLIMRILGPLVNQDRMIGKDFEKGLSRLKTVAEGR